ncbi:ParB/RepB/Spo0J family partition protein [Dactylosporangium sp. CA-092794]|uniref:ParB/RepB/Spo0J family partition protein n=1 Tax=Dactylosporangium sp. CA-092794 TaxID=3239929 RepID=UPI003D8A8CED
MRGEVAGAAAAGEAEPSTRSLREGQPPELSPVELVEIGALRPGDSPRSGGEVDEHIRVLAEIDTAHAPIVVHRGTMRVIDGMHRLRAAMLRGEATIAVRYFEGCERDAFVIGVELNTAHGYPLSRKDRTAAAGRILASHPQWSDRSIARVAGLSANTVGGLRRAMAAELPQVHTRLGHDGRSRPVSAAHGRQRAVELIAENPDASMRRIAREAGISPRTVADVRDRLSRGENPVEPKRTRREAPPGAGPPAPPRPAAGARGGTGALETLMNDPSLRLTERGRLMLRLLTSYSALARSRDDLLENLPAHCTNIVSLAAQECGEAWLEFARDLQRRAA